MTKKIQYLITINNPPLPWQEEVKKMWETGKFKYIAAQLEECPTTKTIHIQGFLSLHNQMTITALHKTLPIFKKTHFTEVIWDYKASTYPLKEETRVEPPVEYGEKPLTKKEAALKGAEKRAAENQKIIELGAVKSVDQGLIRIHDIKRINEAIGLYKLLKEPLRDEDDCRGLWLYGDPGVGKSTYARTMFSSPYLKGPNKWWDGFSGQKVVLLDDFDKTHEWMSYYIKIWADKWSFMGEVKGGTINVNYSLFIITSNYLPEDIWKIPDNQTLVDAIRRRFKFQEIIKNINRD